jgi:hypothetical protein
MMGRHGSGIAEIIDLNGRDRAREDSARPVSREGHPCRTAMGMFISRSISAASSSPIFATTTKPV